MKNGFLEALEVRPRTDRGLQFTLVVLAPAAILAIQLADLPPAGRWIVLAAVLFACGYGVALRVCPGARKPVERAMLLPDGRWTVVRRGGSVVGACLVRAWGVSLGTVVALEWQCEDGCAGRLWVFRVDMPDPAWRRLRVRLRMS